MKNFHILVFLFCFVIPVSINIVQFSTAIVALSQVDRETPLVNFALLLGLLFYLLFGSMSTRKKSRKYTNKHGASKCLFCPSHILLISGFRNSCSLYPLTITYIELCLFYDNIPRYICMRIDNRTFIFQILMKSTC